MFQDTALFAGKFRRTGQRFLQTGSQTQCCWKFLFCKNSSWSSVYLYQFCTSITEMAVCCPSLICLPCAFCNFLLLRYWLQVFMFQYILMAFGRLFLERSLFLAHANPISHHYFDEVLFWMPKVCVGGYSFLLGTRGTISYTKFGVYKVYVCFLR